MIEAQAHAQAEAMLRYGGIVYLIVAIAVWLYPIVRGNKEADGYLWFLGAATWPFMAFIFAIAHIVKLLEDCRPYGRATEFMSVFWARRRAAKERQVMKTVIEAPKQERSASGRPIPGNGRSYKWLESAERDAAKGVRVSSQKPVSGDRLQWDGQQLSPTGGQASLEEEAMAELEEYLCQSDKVKCSL
jgi:hypothetical protein